MVGREEARFFSLFLLFLQNLVEFMKPESGNPATWKGNRRAYVLYGERDGVGGKERKEEKEEEAWGDEEVEKKKWNR